MELKEQMLKICATAGFEPTDNIDRIVRLKERFGIGLRCPCDKDNPARFCISEQCANDIKNDGRCHCGCYRKKS